MKPTLVSLSVHTVYVLSDRATGVGLKYNSIVQGETALHAAAGNVWDADVVVKALLDAKADIRAVTSQVHPPVELMVICVFECASLFMMCAFVWHTAVCLCAIELCFPAGKDCIAFGKRFNHC